MLALKEAGVLGIGQTPNDEDTNDSFTLLQRMVAQWQKRRWLVPSLFEMSKLWSGGKVNTIGDDGFFNTPRPNKISAAWIVQSATGSNNVSLPLRPIFSFEDYALIALKDMTSLPTRFFYDAHFPLGNLYLHPVPTDDQYTVHIVIESQLGFATTISDGDITTAGILYTNGVYAAVPLTGGSGTGATANVTIAGGIVTAFAIQNGGKGYQVNDDLSVAAANVGGTGAGFVWNVTQTDSSLDSEILMPPEYEEAIHYNLAIRLCSMYQEPAGDDTKRLAKSALNTIRVANTQIPRLIMPPGLRTGPSFSLYNPDGY